MEKKELINPKMWAYYASDGHIQVRSIGESKTESREMIAKHEPAMTFKDYERAGYVLSQIDVKILPLPAPPPA